EYKLTFFNELALKLHYTIYSEFSNHVLLHSLSMPPISIAMSTLLAIMHFLHFQYNFPFYMTYRTYIGTFLMKGTFSKLDFKVSKQFIFSHDTIHIFNLNDFQFEGYISF